MYVRLAEISDLDVIVELCKKHHAESFEHLPALSLEKGKGYIEKVIKEGYPLVLIDKNEIVGMCLGMAESLWYSDEVFMVDAFTYILPEHRKGLAIFKLWRTLKLMADKLNIRLYFAHTSGVHVESKDKLYERFNLKRVGSLYIGEK